MGEDKGEVSKQSGETLTPLLDPLQKLQQLLSAFGEKGVIIGGVAVSYLGAPRFTVDLDAVFILNLEDIPKLITEAEKLGIEPRISDPIAFARKNRVVLLRHKNSGVDIDVSLGVLPFEIEMVERSQVVEVGSVQLRLPTPEDLIIMKAVAHRPKDLEDIRTVADSHPNMDRKRIEYWVRQFGEALELPDLWKSISQIIDIR